MESSGCADISNLCPKKEKGYTAIANELFEALCKAYIPARERQCLDFIIRQTFGYNRKEDRISLSQFEKATGLKKRSVRDCLRSLEEKRLIIVTPGTFRTPKCYQFNKYYDQWSVQKNTHSAGQHAQSVQTDTHRSMQKNTHHKRKKEILKKPQKFAVVGGGDFYITKKKKRLSGKRLATFDRFWTCFDYKKAKAEAADAWLEIPSLTDLLVDQICLAAEQEAKRRPLLINQGRTPKYAQGWLTGRRWEDEEHTSPAEQPTQKTLVYEVTE